MNPEVQLEEAHKLALKYLPDAKWTPDPKLNILSGVVGSARVYVNSEFASLSEDRRYLQASSKAPEAGMPEHLMALIEVLPKEDI
jgi:hypothetical protein